MALHLRERPFKGRQQNSLNVMTDVNYGHDI